MFVLWQETNFDKQRFPDIWHRPGLHRLRRCWHGDASFFRNKAKSSDEAEREAYRFMNKVAQGRL